ncbi:IS200/IS605 family transposase [Aridibaculum aurantiacum]|uniref:IS200/IS605 family transposase n=1 Tax=Aridibaculum aurantiacum TaxID=2810307 RepID=UPI001F612976|nr:IS200/IS605 family transposase [Aridibaculum aurantiacum]
MIKIWIHLVWATKHRHPLLKDSIRRNIFNHIRVNGRKKGLFIDCINGYTDHMHCLISLGAEQTIAKVVQLIKGESSYWINQQQLTEDKFEWQDEYFAVSVSESMLATVRTYIYKQEEHHKKQTFQQEYDAFIGKYGFNVVG